MQKNIKKHSQQKTINEKANRKSLPVPITNIAIKSVFDTLNTHNIC
jgi:hypothetical protein